MKRYLLGIVSLLVACVVFAQPASSNTLLWKVSGKGLTKPTYIFGTIHMICADDLQLSPNLQTALSSADGVYLELDMDNMFEMLSVVGKMKMRNDTTLADLLTAEEYQKVKTFFSGKKSPLPFAVLETYKPMLAASTLIQANMGCANSTAVDMLVMKEAKKKGKSIKGLETMAYQMSIFDSIPYGLQAKQLVQYVDNYGKEADNNDMEALTKAYRSQELTKLEEITRSEDMGMASFTELLLYKRNEAWVKKLEKEMTGRSLVVAVGAGHLPGERGVLTLLRKAGYTVEPVENDMVIKPKEQQM